VNNLRLVGATLLITGTALAQHVISAKSGLIHYTEGKVLLAGEPIAPKATEFPEVKVGQELRTELGRAEILLTPSVILRVAENSAIKMLSNALEDTQIELLAGSVLLEAGEIQKGQMLAIRIGQSGIEFPKRGLFRIDYDSGRLRVYEGSALVVASGQTSTVKEGRQVELAGVLAPEKFNKEIGDAFHRWAGRRSSYLAMANYAAARSIGASDIPWQSSAWIFNPYFGQFTYIPLRGRYRSPFGWSYYSPETAYRRPVVWGGGGMGSGIGAADMGSRGYGDYGSRGSSGYGGGSVGVSAPPPAASSAPAPAVTDSRGSDGGSRGDSRGGR
jgi:hypothetical protein